MRLLALYLNLAAPAPAAASLFYADDCPVLAQANAGRLWCVEARQAGSDSGVAQGLACHLWWLEQPAGGLPHEAETWSPLHAAQCCYYRGGADGFGAGLARGYATGACD